MIENNDTEEHIICEGLTYTTSVAVIVRKDLVCLRMRYMSHYVMVIQTFFFLNTGITVTIGWL